MRFFALCIVLLFIFTTSAGAEIFITEIMYDAAGSDTNREWIEIYNVGNPINLTGLRIFESGKNHSTTLVNGSAILNNDSYAVIADDCDVFVLEYPEFNRTLFDSSFSLSNTGERLTLYYPDKTVSVEYQDYAGDGYSLEYQNQQWYASRIFGGTPGLVNNPLIINRSLYFDAISYPSKISDLTIPISFSIFNNGTGSKEFQLGVRVGKTDTMTGAAYKIDYLLAPNQSVSYKENLSVSELVAPLYLTVGIKTSDSEYVQSFLLNISSTMIKPKIKAIETYPEILDAGSNISIIVQLENPDDDTIYGGVLDLSVREHTSGEWEKLLDLANQSVQLLPNTTKNISFIWSSDPSLFSGLYKIYADYDYVFNDQDSYRTKSKEFFVNGIANIFIGNWTISKTNLSLNDTAEIQISIQSFESEPHLINLSYIVDNIKTLDQGKVDYLFSCGNYLLDPSTIVLINCTIIIPEIFIANLSESIKSHVELEFSWDRSSLLRKTDDLEITLDGLADLGEPGLQFLRVPSEATFGDISYVLVRYDSKNYNYPLSFLAYGYPSQVLTDIDGTALRSSSTDANIAIKLFNISRGTSYYVAVPIIFKKNCNGQYEDKTYRIRLRAYKRSSSFWKEITTEDFYAYLSGKSSEGCSTTTVSQDLSIGSPIAATNTSSLEPADYSFTYSNLLFNIHLPDLITDTYYNISMSIHNKKNDSQKIMIQGYITQGRKSFGDRIIHEIEFQGMEEKNLEYRYDVPIEVSSDLYDLRLTINSTNRKTKKKITHPVLFQLPTLRTIEFDASIESFYTRATKPADTVNLYALIKNPHSKNLTIILDSLADTKTFNLSETKTLKITTQLLQGYNPLLLSVLEQDKIVDIKKLNLIRNASSITTCTSEEVQYLLASMPTYQVEFESQSEPLIQTSKTVFQSKSTKAVQLTKYFLLFSFFLLGLAYINSNDLG